MTRTAILYDWGTSLDLEPFPCMPMGSLYMNEYFLVHHAMSMFDKLDVTNILVVSEIGAAYLKYAVSEYEKNGKVSVVYVPETSDKGSGRLIQMGIVTGVSDYTEPIPLVPSNVITDLDIVDLDNFHKARKKPYATVVCVPGVNESGLECPVGYRPVNMMMLERHITRCGDKNKHYVSLQDLLLDADLRGRIAYYPFDGMYFEVADEEDYLLVRSGVSKSE